MILKVDASISQDEADEMLNNVLEIIPKLKFEIESYQMLLGILSTECEKNHEMFGQFFDEVENRAKAEFNWTCDRAEEYNAIVEALKGIDTVDLAKIGTDAVELGCTVQERRKDFSQYLRGILELTGKGPTDEELEEFSRTHSPEECENTMQNMLDKFKDFVKEERKKEGVEEEEDHYIQDQILNVKNTVELHSKAYAQFLGSVLGGGADSSLLDQASEVRDRCAAEKEWMESRLSEVSSAMGVITSFEDQTPLTMHQALTTVSKFLVELQERRHELVVYIGNILKAHGTYPSAEDVQEHLSKYKGMDAEERLRALVEECDHESEGE